MIAKVIARVIAQVIANVGGPLTSMLTNQILPFMRATLTLFVVIGLGLQSWAPAIAQTSPTQTSASGVAGGEGHTAGGPRKQLATIIYAGLGGAILGLSTLSFYGRPQEMLANIAIGFAVGVIVGTTFVTYKAASNPNEFYGAVTPSRPLLERDLELASAHSYREDPTPLRASYAWEF